MANSNHEHLRCIGFRDCLANFISSSEFPDDLYPFLFSSLVLFFTLKMFQYSIRLVFSLIRPIAFIVIVLIALQHLPEIKSWVHSNAVLSTAASYVDGFIQYISGILETVGGRIIAGFYPKIFS